MPQITPATIFPNMTADVTGITIPYTDLGVLSQAEADPTTGDGGELAFALNHQIFKAVQSLDATLRPTQSTFTRTVSVQASADIDKQVTRHSFSSAFDRESDLTASVMEAEV